MPQQSSSAVEPLSPAFFGTFSGRGSPEQTEAEARAAAAARDRDLEKQKDTEKARVQEVERIKEAMAGLSALL